MSKPKAVAMLRVPKCVWDAEARAFAFPGIIVATIASDKTVIAYYDEVGFVDLEADSVVDQLVQEVIAEFDQ